MIVDPKYKFCKVEGFTTSEPPITFNRHSVPRDVAEHFVEEIETARKSCPSPGESFVSLIFDNGVFTESLLIDPAMIQLVSLLYAEGKGAKQEPRIVAPQAPGRQQ